ncbi:hypothetical protein F4860DRAFT_325271 [Xylaria cubensis]|nr:hypothetical protein F4860DRAFT_325271 [Xylaria cubensis]
MNGAKDTTKSGPAPATTTTTTVPAVTISKSPAVHADAVYAAAAPSHAHSTTVPLMAGANGNDTNSASAAAASAAINKKRKKDGLKPIITTEGPAPVWHLAGELACAGLLLALLVGPVPFHSMIPTCRYTYSCTHLSVSHSLFTLTLHPIVSRPALLDSRFSRYLFSPLYILAYPHCPSTLAGCNYGDRHGKEKVI